MAISKRIKQGFLRSPLVKKAVLLASALLMVSPLLPWYDNRNTFGIGDSFLGIQGPLFLIGFLVMAFGGISFFNLFLPLMGKHFFKLRKHSGLVAMLLGAQAFLLIMVSNSIFYHPDFGTNVSHKGTRFGLLLAFVSVGVMVISGFMVHRKEKNGSIEDPEDWIFHDEEDAQPAMPVTVPSHDLPRSQGSINNSNESLYGSYQGDPLELDAKTRYKMLKEQQRRRSLEAQGNLWGGSRDLTDNINTREL